MEIGFDIDVTEKEAGDIIQQIVTDLQLSGITVSDYWVEVK